MNVEVHDLGFKYSPEVIALRGVSFTVEKGEKLAILGENGAGKTTLAKHLNGLLRPDSGWVKVGGWDTRQHTPAQMARRVGYAFQNPDDQIFERTVEREVAFGPKNLELDPDERQRRVGEALELFGLERVAEVHPYDLHASQRKLVTLAATVALQPDVIILDEPTTGQDGAGMLRLEEALDYLSGQGSTIIAISHDIDFCAAHFDRSLLMAQGEILADGASESVLSREELLEQAGVAPPQLFRLARSLDMEARPRTPEAFIDRYAEIQPRKGNHNDRRSG